MVVDRFLHERPARASADFPLIDHEHCEAFERLVEEVVVLGHYVSEEDIRRLAAELQRDGDQILRGVLHNESPRCRLSGESDLGDALVRRQRLAGFDAETIDDIEDAGREQVRDEIGDRQNAHRRLLGGLEHDAIAGRERGREFPHRHQNRKIPRNDLADDAERLMEMVGDRVVVDFADRSFLRTDATREIAEVVDSERQVDGGRLANGLAVVDRLRPGPAR